MSSSLVQALRSAIRGWYSGERYQASSARMSGNSMITTRSGVQWPPSGRRAWPLWVYSRAHEQAPRRPRGEVETSDMKILVLGAGAIGGYFGGRLVQAGADVSFLVRQHRQAQLQQTGLVVRSPHGDFAVPVRTVRQEQIDAPADLVLLACKAYDLDEALGSIAPAVGEHTTLVPLLNGVAHITRLQAAFGRCARGRRQLRHPGHALTVGRGRAARPAAPHRVRPACPTPRPQRSHGSRRCWRCFARRRSRPSWKPR